MRPGPLLALALLLLAPPAAALLGATPLPLPDPAAALPALAQDDEDDDGTAPEPVLAVPELPDEGPMVPSLPVDFPSANFGFPCTVAPATPVSEKFCVEKAVTGLLGKERALPGTGSDESLVGKGAGAPEPTPASVEPLPVAPMGADWVVPAPGGPAPRQAAPASAPVVAPAPPAAARSDPILAVVAGASLLLALLAVWKAFAVVLRGRAGRGQATREAILRAIEAEPGIHKQELARRTGRGNGTIEHHVHALVSGGLVVRLLRNGYACHFPASADGRLVAAAAVLKSGVARTLLASAQEHPGLSLSDAARHLGVAPSTVHYHLGRLGDAGLVRFAAPGGLHVTPLGGQALGVWAGAAGAAAAGRP